MGWPFSLEVGGVLRVGLDVSVGLCAGFWTLRGSYEQAGLGLLATRGKHYKE